MQCIPWVSNLLLILFKTSNLKYSLSQNGGQAVDLGSNIKAASQRAVASTPESYRAIAPSRNYQVTEQRRLKISFSASFQTVLHIGFNLPSAKVTNISTITITIWTGPPAPAPQGNSSSEKIQDNESSTVVYITFDLHKVTAVTPCLCASTSHTSLPDCRLCWIFLDNIIIFSLFLTDHCNLPVEESTDKLGAAYSQGAHLKRLEGVLAFATSYDNTSFCHFSSRWWGT